MFTNPLVGPKQTVKPNVMWGRSNELTGLEVRLQKSLCELDMSDMASAIAGGRKYQRLTALLWGLQTGYEGLVGLRLAFDPNATYPKSKEAWVEEAKVRFGSDSGLAEVIAGSIAGADIIQPSTSSESADRSAQGAGSLPSATSGAGSSSETWEASAAETPGTSPGTTQAEPSPTRNVSLLGKLRKWPTSKPGMAPASSTPSV